MVAFLPHFLGQGGGIFVLIFGSCSTSGGHARKNSKGVPISFGAAEIRHSHSLTLSLTQKANEIGILCELGKIRTSRTKMSIFPCEFTCSSRDYTLFKPVYSIYIFYKTRKKVVLSEKKCELTGSKPIARWPFVANAASGCVCCGLLLESNTMVIQAL